MAERVRSLPRIWTDLVSGYIPVEEMGLQDATMPVGATHIEMSLVARDVSGRTVEPQDIVYSAAYQGGDSEPRLEFIEASRPVILGGFHSIDAPTAHFRTPAAYQERLGNVVGEYRGGDAVLPPPDDTWGLEVVAGLVVPNVAAFKSQVSVSPSGSGEIPTQVRVVTNWVEFSPEGAVSSREEFGDNLETHGSPHGSFEQQLAAIGGIITANSRRGAEHYGFPTVNTEGRRRKPQHLIGITRTSRMQEPTRR